MHVALQNEETHAKTRMVMQKGKVGIPPHNQKVSGSSFNPPKCFCRTARRFSSALGKSGAMTSHSCSGVLEEAIVRQRIDAQDVLRGKVETSGLMRWSLVTVEGRKPANMRTEEPGMWGRWSGLCLLSKPLEGCWC